MKRFLTVAVFVFLLVSSKPALAIPLVVDSGWQPFSFGGVGSSWNNTFQFTLVGSGTLKVTDAFQSGDQFNVFNFGSSIGATSVPGSVGDQIFANYDGAFFLFCRLVWGGFGLYGDVIGDQFDSYAEYVFFSCVKHLKRR